MKGRYRVASLPMAHPVTALAPVARAFDLRPCRVEQASRDPSRARGRGARA